MRYRPMRALGIMVLLLVGVISGPSMVALAQTAPTPTEATYLADTAPFRPHLGELQAQLSEYQEMATEGRLDEIATTDLGALTRDLFAARQAYAGAEPSARLDQYHRTMLLALDRSYAAAVLLVKAHGRESVSEQEALLRQAGIFASSGAKLLQEATAELAALFPGVAG